MKNLPYNLVRTVQILNDGLSHSGDELGQVLAISRAAVWKIIKKLQDYGIEIDSIKGKGYTLKEPLILLDKEQIYQSLSNGLPVGAIKIFASLNSTNEYFKKHKIKDNQPAVCLAEQQTGGRGRLSRTWHSPFAKNIYFSCRYVFNKDLAELAGLSLVVNLATLCALKKYSPGKNCFVKWPSDIILADKKIAGNLIEIQAEANGSSEAIIGIGINVNMLNSEQNFICTSLREVSGEYFNRNPICADLIICLLNYLQRFEQQGFSGFLQEWLANDYLTHKSVSVTHHHQKILGSVQGVNTYGYLLLKLANGEQCTFSAGDIFIE